MYPEGVPVAAVKEPPSDEMVMLLKVMLDGCAVGSVCNVVRLPSRQRRCGVVKSTGFVSYWHNQYQCADAIRIANGYLHRRRRTCRNANYSGLLDA